MIVNTVPHVNAVSFVVSVFVIAELSTHPMLSECVVQFCCCFVIARDVGGRLYRGKEMKNTFDVRSASIG